MYELVASQQYEAEAKSVPRTKGQFSIIIGDNELTEIGQCAKEDSPLNQVVRCYFALFSCHKAKRKN